jgi:endo-1,4-beta-D-glucanase Y/4-amino-4-deoxy-L-arabinose transferase-like glycosyltransferase
VLVALLAHGLNMFNFPARTLLEDEGIYAEQAWAVLLNGHLAPYTYTYDHAPGGWIMVAAWYALSGGHTTFGGAIQSGRVLMLLLHVAMVPLLFHLARKLGAGLTGAGLAAFLFSLSPLAIFYQRLLLLDTIMLFWVLVSLDLLLNGWGSLSRIVLGGTCFGIAALSKETALFLLPAVLVIAFLDRRRHQGRFAVFGWLVPMLMVASLYPVFALVKGELLPATDASHVSLLGALGWQLSRGGGGPFNLDNQFWQLVRTTWVPRDPVLMLGGVAAVAFNLVHGARDRRALATGLLGLLPLTYLARGGLVLDFYILAAIPFLCLNVAVACAPLLRRLPSTMSAGVGGVAAVALLVGWWSGGLLRPLYAERPGDVGDEALAWISQHLPADSRIITRDDFWTALRDPGPGGTAFPHAHSHWKVAQDQDVRNGEFNNTWETVDYLIMWGHGLEDDFRTAGNQVALDALQHAHLVRRWAASEGDDAVHLRPDIELWKVDRPGVTEASLLADSARYQESQFGRDGAFVDRTGAVTSEAQAYAMLRAVWSDDRAAFDRSWGWTQAHLTRPDGLLSWVWRDGAVADAHSATDADTDIALALLLAGRHWHDQRLQDAGVGMAQAIWQHEVAVVGDTPYVTAGDWATTGSVVALNPSYLAPYAYAIFAEVDPDHNWWWLVDTSYRVLFESARSPLGAEKSAGLPPDWVGLDRASGQFVPLDLPGVETTRYGYDAARTYWRVALHYHWTGDGRAEAFLQQSGFLQDEVTRPSAEGAPPKGTVSAVYARDGSIVEEAPSIVGETGALSALMITNRAAANQLFAAHLVGGANRAPAGVYWGDPRDLYAQEWGWFATALSADAVPDRWHAP